MKILSYVLPSPLQNHSWNHLWWSRKKSGKSIFCHSCASRNPVFLGIYYSSGFPFSREWQLITNSSFLFYFKSQRRKIWLIIKPTTTATTISQCLFQKVLSLPWILFKLNGLDLLFLRTLFSISASIAHEFVNYIKRLKSEPLNQG